MRAPSDQQRLGREATATSVLTLSPPSFFLTSLIAAVAPEVRTTT